MSKDNSKSSFGNLEKTIVKNRDRIIVTLVSLLFVIFLLNSFFIISSVNTLDKKVIELKEFNTPLNISLEIINCNSCSNVSSIVEGIKSKNVKVLNENIFDSNSNEAKNLILKYNLKKLPSVIITGEINNSKVKFDNFKLDDGALVFSDVKAPYFDVASKEIKGKVKIIQIIDSSCKECASLSSIPTNFGKIGVLITNWEKIEYNSVEGKKLIEEFGIKRIPALLISSGIDYYKDIQNSLSKLGLNEIKGFYLLRAVQPPYRNLSENKITGLVDLITLTDESCSTCYNVSVNKQILKRLGVVIKNENDYDISSSKGRELISKYNLQEVPTILLSPEAGAYSSFVKAWKPIGDVESDGWFVMRKPEVLGTVKDIINGTIIKAKK